MIYLVRTARAQQGRAQAALPWAVEVANYINETYPEMSVEVVTNVNGPIDQVHWVSRYESLAALEAAKEKLDRDDVYQELTAGFQSIFVLSSAEDNIYRTIP